MSRIKYILLLILTVAFVVYRLLLSFNLLPYYMSGEDITAVLILFAVLLLFFIAGSVERTAERLNNIHESISVNVRTDGFDALALSDQIRDTAGVKLLIGIQKYLIHITSVEELLNKFLVITVKLTGSERASIMLHDSRRDELFVYKTIGWESREIHLAKKMKSRPGEGIAGRVFLDGELLVVNKNSDKEDIDIKDKYKSKSFVSFPIFKGNSIIGVLNLTEKGDSSYTQNELDIIRYIIGVVALKLSSLNMEAELPV
jgi:transcriptional regulator with GAF, ATPase, and Fis domain